MDLSLIELDFRPKLHRNMYTHAHLSHDYMHMLIYAACRGSVVGGCVEAGPKTSFIGWGPKIRASSAHL